ncbi:MAG: VCBS repeat-containing protein [bacterium]|nr:VCBS repeat-containing protein [bacterium]
MTLRTPLLVAGLSSLAFFVAGTGAGATWVETARGLPRQGQWRNGFDLADLNGDGRLDLVHGPPRRQMGEPRIFIGEPGVRFSRWLGASFPELPFDYGDAAAADFDGDGHADLALGIHLRGLVVLLGDGRGSFSKQASFLAAQPGGPAFSSRALAVADLDGDGRPDIVAIGEGPRLRGGPEMESYGLRVLLNRSPGAWDWRRVEPERGRLFGDDLALGDFDGDGRPDIVTASHVQGQRGVLFWGAGDGTFAPAELEVARPSSYIDAVAAADFDGDGDDDLAVAYTDLQTPRARVGVDLLLSTGDRTWARRQLLWSESAQRPTAMTAGDPDADGDSDLIVLSESGALRAFVNAAGSLEPGPALSSEDGGNGCRGYHVQLADLDGDGRDGVLAGFADEGCPGGGSLRGWKWSQEAERDRQP